MKILADERTLKLVAVCPGGVLATVPVILLLSP
jgi:hypothetical protein